jgi:hypothetical protein
MLFKKETKEIWQMPKSGSQMNQMEQLIKSETIWYFLGIPYYKKTLVKDF